MLEKIIQKIVNAAASTPVFVAATLLSAGWLTGLIHTSGVFQPSGLDGICSFWLGFAILRSSNAVQKAQFIYMKELVRAVPEAHNEILDIEKEPESVIVKTDEEVGKRPPTGA